MNLKTFVTIQIIFCFIIGIVTLLNSTSRRYQHADRFINAEFDDVWNAIYNDNYMQTRTTAELQAIAPRQIGEYYWNTNTNEIWISTGTAAGNFIQK